MMKIRARRINTLIYADMFFDTIKEARNKNPGFEEFREVSSK